MPLAMFYMRWLFLLKLTFQKYLLLKFSALLYLTKWNSENLPARPPFCRESQWEISSTRLPPLLCEFDMKFRRILSEMQKIPNVQGGDVYCARRLLFQQKVFHFLWSHHPASQSSLCMELDQFFTALWNTTFGSLFLQQVICYNWKILQLSDRLEKACLNLFCWFNRQARYS